MIRCLQRCRNVSRITSEFISICVFSSLLSFAILSSLFGHDGSNSWLSNVRLINIVITLFGRHFIIKVLSSTIHKIYNYMATKCMLLSSPANSFWWITMTFKKYTSSKISGFVCFVIMLLLLLPLYNIVFFSRRFVKSESMNPVATSRLTCACIYLYM